jgi:hypothetical protein
VDNGLRFDDYYRVSALPRTSTIAGSMSVSCPLGDIPRLRLNRTKSLIEAACSLTLDRIVGLRARYRSRGAVVAMAYLISHHQSEKPMAVVRVDIPSAIAINFANSQYDTNAIT